MANYSRNEAPGFRKS